MELQDNLPLDITCHHHRQPHIWNLLEHFKVGRPSCVWDNKLLGSYSRNGIRLSGFEEYGQIVIRHYIMYRLTFLGDCNDPEVIAICLV